MIGISSFFLDVEKQEQLRFANVEWLSMVLSTAPWEEEQEVHWVVACRKVMKDGRPEEWQGARQHSWNRHRWAEQTREHTVGK